MLLWPEQTRSDDGIFDNSCVTTLQSWTWTLDTGDNDQSPSNNVLVNWLTPLLSMAILAVKIRDKEENWGGQSLIKNRIEKHPFYQQLWWVGIITWWLELQTNLREVSAKNMTNRQLYGSLITKSLWTSVPISCLLTMFTHLISIVSQ